MKTVIAAAGIDPKEKRFPKAEVVADIFSMAVNTGRDVARIVDEKYPYFLDQVEQLRAVHTRYEAKKRATNTMDFDDLLEKTLRLLADHEEVATIYQRQFQFVLVDEYQDTNHIQAQFVDLLAAKHGNVMVVGDDAQSIYSWRGADFQNIIQFPKRYPNARTYKIETNYRSVPEILQVANAAIEANVQQFPKNLQAHRETRSVKPALIELNDSNQQGQFVTQRILELRDEGVELNEIAVLYRAHYHALELQIELTRHGVPFQITSGLRFFEQAHIKDVASFLKFAANHQDEVAFKRIVRLLPGIGGVAADKLWAHFEKALAGREAVDSFTDALGGARGGRQEREDVETVRPHAGRDRSGRQAHRAVERHREHRRGGVRRIRKNQVSQLRSAARGTQCARQLRTPILRPGGVPVPTGARLGTGNRGRPSTPAARNAKPSGLPCPASIRPRGWNGKWCSSST